MNSSKSRRVAVVTGGLGTALAICGFTTGAAR